MPADRLNATALLDGSATLTGRESPEVRQIFQDFYASDLEREQDMIAWGRKRSAASGRGPIR